MPDPEDKEPIIKKERRTLVCAGINSTLDDLSLFFRIKGVTVDGSISASRIDWQDIDAEPDEPSTPAESAGLVAC